jgi:hypothetical protein
MLPEGSSEEISIFLAVAPFLAIAIFQFQSRR